MGEMKLNAGNALALQYGPQRKLSAEMVFPRAMLVAGVCCLIALTGCASIVHGTNQDLVIDSFPSGASVSIADLRGRVVSEGLLTPCRVTLKRGTGYFRNGYVITASKRGYETARRTVSGRISGWYFSNLFFGAYGLLLGGLILDPLTGAMWNLSPEKVEISLAASVPLAAGYPTSGNGTITVDCSELGAELLIDGALVGNPPAMLNLRTGPHVIEVRRTGFENYLKDILITENSPVKIRAELTKRKM